MSVKKKMGRPPIYKTDKARKAAKSRSNKAYLKGYHLRVRKPRYADDPEYREKLLKGARARYVANHPDYRAKGLGAQAGDAMAASRLCLVRHHDRRQRILDIDTMAGFIGVSTKVMSEWIEAGKFPRPVFEDAETGQRVYSVPQADALAGVLKDMLKMRATFRATDTEVIVKLHQVFT